MRSKLTRILALLGAGIVLYFLLRSSVTSRQANADVPQDTMCLASRIGLPCRPD